MLPQGNCRFLLGSWKITKRTFEKSLIRVSESLNDALDDTVKITRRNIGKKIRKERLVAIAIEALLTKVEQWGG